MSSILNALKKLEDKAPDISHDPEASLLLRSSRSRSWGVTPGGVLAVTLILCLVVAVGALWWRGGPSSSSPAVVAPPETRTPAPIAGEPARPPAVPVPELDAAPPALAPSPASPPLPFSAPAPPERTEALPDSFHPNRLIPPKKDLTAPKPDGLPSRPGLSGEAVFPIVVPRASRPDPQPVPRPLVRTDISPVRETAPMKKESRETTGETRDAGKSQTSPGAETSATQPVGSGSEIPLVSPEHLRLPVKTADEVGLEVQALVWSPEPEDRMAVINGEILRTGGMVAAGGVVEFIGGDYVVVRKEKERWRLMFQVR